MKKFLVQVFIFTLPFILACLIIILIDPYNFYNYYKINDNNSKLKIINRSYESEVRGNVLWKIFEFKRKPFKNIIIGDSQCYDINMTLLNKTSGNEYYNLSIPGANIETKLAFFWFAAAETKLNHVIIQISFQNLSMNRGTNLFHLAQEQMEKPYLYLFNLATLMDSYQNIKFRITKNHQTGPNLLSFPITDYKNRKLNSMLDEMYWGYSYSNSYINELKKIVEFCRFRNISIEFLVMPIHQIYYNYLEDHQLTKFYNQFILNITELSTTYDFSRDSNIIYNERYFIDYFHQNQLITDSITRLICKKQDAISQVKQ